MIYIVVPCYNEQETLTETTRRLLALSDELADKGENIQILYTDDGSKDETWNIIRQLQASDPRIHGIRLAHNVGHQTALWAGMESVVNKAEAIISIDADLQDDIDVIPRMIARFREGTDIVYGVRRERTTDSFFKRMTAQGFYKLMNKLGCETVYNHADFRLLSRRALKALLSYPERNLFLRGMVPTLGFSVAKEFYNRMARMTGESKYPFSRMLGLALDGITSFSIRPIRWIHLAGILFFLIALGVIIWAIVQHINGHAIQGWTSLLISVWLVGGCLLCAIGIVGEYIGKIYIESKRRPRYFIMDEVGENEDNIQQEKS